MGTWSTKIEANDTFQDIYQNFFDLYNQGQQPSIVFRAVRKDFADMFNNYEDRHNSLFGLALAQWETQSLDPIIFEQVKEIVETGKDLEVWKSLGADEKTLKKRKLELERFLTRISVEKSKPRRRVKPKFEVEVISLVKILAPDGLKYFNIDEVYTNKNYNYTSGTIMWANGGGSVLHFTIQNKNVSAKWLSAHMLEITHDKDIAFTKKDDGAYFSGDKVNIEYRGL